MAEWLDNLKQVVQSLGTLQEAGGRTLLTLQIFLGSVVLLLASAEFRKWIRFFRDR